MTIRKMILAGAATAALVSAALPAAAQTSSVQNVTPYAHFEHWGVAWDANVHGCLMQSAFPDGTMLRLGIDDTNQKLPPVAYVMLGNPAWASLTPGSTFSVGMTLDNGPAYSWTGKVLTLTGGAHVLSMPTKDFGFLLSVARGSVLDFTHDGKPVLRVNLTGSMQAASALAACQAAYNPLQTASAPTVDPFQPTAPVAKPDPFRV